MKNSLNDLLLFCGKKQIGFVLSKDENQKNFIVYNLSDNQVVVNISDSDDKEFVNVLQSKLEELKNLFK